MMQKRGNHYLVLIAICVIGVGALLVGRHFADKVSQDKTGSSGTKGAQEVQSGGRESGDAATSAQQNKDGSGNAAEIAKQKNPLIDAEGNTLETRIHTPEGYTRVAEDAGSLASFLRTYKMKKDGSPVRLYDGKKKGNQNAHVAIFRLPIEKVDLQQCADSVMRVYAEYYWHTDQKDKIAFHFVDGFLAEYSKWQQGYRIDVSDNGSSWVKSASADSSYSCFQKYLRVVFSYASTLSMEQESRKIKLTELQVGDIFIKGGSPGHVVMVVDVCENASGEKAFLLAQGYMPAQEFHVLKNPAYAEDPWYYAGEVSYPFETPEYTFEKGSLRRPRY